MKAKLLRGPGQDPVKTKLPKNERGNDVQFFQFFIKNKMSVPFSLCPTLHHPPPLPSLSKLRYPDRLRFSVRYLRSSFRAKLLPVGIVAHAEKETVRVPKQLPTYYLSTKRAYLLEPAPHPTLCVHYKIKKIAKK